MMRWYLLVGRPLAPVAAPHVRRAMGVHVAGSLAYYAIYLCTASTPEWAAQRELAEAVVASGIPGLYFLVLERRATREARASA
jgi:hypothetical protein